MGGLSQAVGISPAPEGMYVNELLVEGGRVVPSGGLPLWSASHTNGKFWAHVPRMPGSCKVWPESPKYLPGTQADTRKLTCTQPSGLPKTQER